MPTYRIKLEQEIDAETPEEAAETFRQWLQDEEGDPYLPIVDVAELVEERGEAKLFGDDTPMDIAVFEWWHVSQCLHLKPFVEHFDEDPEEGREQDEPEDSGIETAGWYSRLSAPGYLDCTEWDGPHDTQYLAMEALFNMHGE